MRSPYEIAANDAVLLTADDLRRLQSQFWVFVLLCSRRCLQMQSVLTEARK